MARLSDVPPDTALGAGGGSGADGAPPDGDEGQLRALADAVAAELMDGGPDEERMKRRSAGIPGVPPALPREACCRALAEFLCSPGRFAEYFSTLDKARQGILVRMAFSWGMITEDVGQAIGVPSTGGWDRDRRAYDGYPLSFAIKYGYMKSCAVPPRLAQCLRLQLARLRPQERTVSEESMRGMDGFFSGGQGMEFFIHAGQVVQVLKDCGFFERAAGTVILKGVRAKVLAHVPFSPFTAASRWSRGGVAARGVRAYSPQQAQVFENARLDLCIAFLAAALTPPGEDTPRPDAVPADPLALYRMLVTGFIESPNVLFDRKFLYPHLTLGNRERAAVRLGRYRGVHFRDFLAAIKAHPPKTPVRFSDFLDRMEERHFPRPADTQSVRFSGRRAVIIQSDARAYTGENRVDIDNDALYRAMLYEPAYTNLFLLFAALGLFSITWEPPAGAFPEAVTEADWRNGCDYCRFGRIGYIQMTALGAYTFGLTDSFTAPGIKAYAPPVLDERSPAIHIEEGDRAMQLFFEPFCVRQSSVLYQADAELLRRYCRTAMDVEALFKMISDRARRPLPEVWLRLKASVLERFVMLRTELDWLVIPLDGQGVRFVQSMERLCRQGLCCKMEGHRMAVRAQDIERLTRRLEDEGFKVR